jgi:hypothetical protein
VQRVAGYVLRLLSGDERYVEVSMAAQFRASCDLQICDTISPSATILRNAKEDAIALLDRTERDRACTHT